MFRTGEGFIAGDFSEPRHPDFQLWVMSGIQPSNASTPAKTGNSQFRFITIMFHRPIGCMVEIGKYLVIRHFTHNFTEDVANVGIVTWVALTKIELGRDSHVSLLCQTATDILNMFMHTKNFLHH